MEKKMKSTTVWSVSLTSLVWNHSHQRQNAAPPSPAMELPNHAGPKYSPKNMER